MGRGIRLDLDDLRKRQAVQRLATLIGCLPGAAAFDPDEVARAATACLTYAVEQGFTLGRGATVVGLLAAQFGLGFMHDAAHPQLAAVFQTDIVENEPYRLALINQWADWHAKRLVSVTPEAKFGRLSRLCRLIDDHGIACLSQNPAALFHAIDPAMATAAAPAQWDGVASQWQGYFTQVFPTAGQSQLDYARALAFCLGQYFTSDPLWDRFSDLRIERLRALES